VPPGDHQLHFQVMRTPDMEEIIPQIKLRVYSQVSLSQSYEGHYMQDPQGVQVV
jgi:hypothetical protein